MQTLNDVSSTGGGGEASFFSVTLGRSSRRVWVGRNFWIKSSENRLCGPPSRFTAVIMGNNEICYSIEKLDTGK